jgi:hypothetical protein
MTFQCLNGAGLGCRCLSWWQRGAHWSWSVHVSPMTICCCMGLGMCGCDTHVGQHVSSIGVMWCEREGSLGLCRITLYPPLGACIRQHVFWIGFLLDTCDTHVSDSLYSELGSSWTPVIRMYHHWCMWGSLCPNSWACIQEDTCETCIYGLVGKAQAPSSPLIFKGLPLHCIGFACVCNYWWLMRDWLAYLPTMMF